MFGLPPCTTPTRIVCPDEFRLGSSEWIDASNVGSLPDGVTPPVGIRLMWNQPGQGNGLHGQPVRYKVCRAGPFVEEELLIIPNPTHGHHQRLVTLSRLWYPLIKQGPNDYIVGPTPCSSVQAVHIVMNPGAPVVSITLIDTSGEACVTCNIGDGAEFYYELPNIHRLSFSAPPKANRVKGLALGPNSDINFDEIASIDAKAWLDNPLAAISARMAAGPGAPFVTISEEAWQDFQQHGREALQPGADVADKPVSPAGMMKLLLGVRWEFATLIGCGFIDGPDRTSPPVDSIKPGALLPAPKDRVFAYQVVAEYEAAASAPGGSAAVQPGANKVGSFITFTIAKLMPPLSGANVESLGARTRVERSNNMPPAGKGDMPKPASPAVDKPICTGSWEIVADNSVTEKVWTTMTVLGAGAPDPDTATGNASELVFGPPVLSAKPGELSRTFRRDHTGALPFINSKIQLAIEVGDSWDRRLGPVPGPVIEPEIAYEGSCPSIASGKVADNTSRQATATLTLDMTLPWTADDTARHGSKSRIDVYMATGQLPSEAQVTVFEPTPINAFRWHVRLDTTLQSDDLAVFVGGILTVGQFQGLINGFNSSGSDVECEFETSVVCAGTELWAPEPNGTRAVLTEPATAIRLWDYCDSFPLAADGTPSATPMTVTFLAPPVSRTLYFASRLAFEIDELRCATKLTPRCAVIFMAPAPEKPNLRVSVRALATDFYGRTVLRVEAAGSDRFKTSQGIANPPPETAITAAVELSEGEGAGAKPSSLPALLGNADPPSDGTPKKPVPIVGLWGPQAALENRVLFESFQRLANLEEGSVNRIGIRYVRNGDNRDSEADETTFPNRRTW